MVCLRMATTLKRRELRAAIDAFQIASSKDASYEANFKLFKEDVTLSGPVTILDSSFNPPTKAHLRLIGDKGLLVFGTKNADKPSPPMESIMHRVEMMKLLPIQSSVAITSYATFSGKSRALHSLYPDLVQTWVLGYDTLVRVFDPKYYGGDSNMLDELASTIFNNSTVRCAYRAGYDRSEMAKFLETAHVKPFKKQIEMMELSDHEQSLSSTKAREAAKNGDLGLLKEILPAEIVEYVIDEKLYSE